ncbi:hypothetical protein BGZ80_008116 [Entomortierella chlamydospora]|uniref:Uncharacterized protein n=1 Tax=Entomortierella chlamydospora TaxID=101097 RepID=A0A9P6SRH5_9FUNG|nr:hypothetical protein BGZ80_008116 [Entomortierella chlamydospora]
MTVAGGTSTPPVAAGTPLEGAGLGLTGMNVNINIADHGRVSPALKEGASTTLPPKAVEVFAHNDKGQVLWFAGPPLDLVPLPKPHHSVEYLAKRQKLRSGKAHRLSLPNGISVAGSTTTTTVKDVNGFHGVSDNVEETLPVILQGLEALKDQLNMDVQIIQSS